MRTLLGLMFGAILTPLGVRLILPFRSLPEQVAPFEALLIIWTDILAAPFRALDAGSLVAGFLPPAAPFGPRLDPVILAALIGWSVVQMVAMGVVGLFRRRSR